MCWAQTRIDDNPRPRPNRTTQGEPQYRDREGDGFRGRLGKVAYFGRVLRAGDTDSTLSVLLHAQLYLHIRYFTYLLYMGPSFIVPSEGLGTFYHIIPRNLCGCDDDGCWLQPG